MDDISNKISEILSDPSALEQIKALGGMLLNGEGASVPPAEDEASGTAPSGMPSFSPEMMQMFMKIMPLLSSFKTEDDNTKLLSALRPFMSEARCKKIDEAIKMMQIMKIAPLLKSGGLFEA